MPNLVGNPEVRISCVAAHIIHEYFQEEGHNLGSLHCVISPYFGKNSVVMLGDAGHAMLPFLGQGLNSGLEDVCLLLDCLDQEKGTVQNKQKITDSS